MTIWCCPRSMAGGYILLWWCIHAPLRRRFCSTARACDRAGFPPQEAAYQPSGKVISGQVAALSLAAWDGARKGGGWANIVSAPGTDATADRTASSSCSNSPSLICAPHRTCSLEPVYNLS